VCLGGAGGFVFACLAKFLELKPGAAAYLGGLHNTWF